ncbi:MAG TPA: hypothetical protein VMU02_06805 [bacterium]|nr:hypothetical protein [bacterium]
MRFWTIGLACALSLGLAGLVFADDTANQTVQLNVDDICVIDVTGNPGTLTIVAPGTGGQTPPNDSDNSTYAQYTSVVPGATRRTITAAWGGSDAAPSGTSLLLEVTAVTAGCGSRVVGGITMSAVAQDVVTAIPSCATGTGGTDGAQLNYTLSVDDVSQLDASDDQTVTVTLTLTDAS